jgi:hypothetical protein
MAYEMKAKWTPGPWNARTYSSQFQIYADDIHIATVLKRTERGSSIYDADETRANARLIAAAPLLVELLSAIAYNDDRPHGDDCLVPSRLLGMARKLLAEINGTPQAQTEPGRGQITTDPEEKEGEK